MFNYRNLPPTHQADCSQCGKGFRNSRENDSDVEDLCQECSYYRDHPERAPGYYTWTRGPQGWLATAKWSDHEPTPIEDDTITVHRQDGNSSLQIVTELVRTYMAPDGNRTVVCAVRTGVDR